MFIWIALGQGIEIIINSNSNRKCNIAGHFCTSFCNFSKSFRFAGIAKLQILKEFKNYNSWGIADWKKGIEKRNCEFAILKKCMFIRIALDQRIGIILNSNSSRKCNIAIHFCTHFAISQNHSSLQELRNCNSLRNVEITIPEE